MDEDNRFLKGELDRQFELRTGLLKRDKSRYWNTTEGKLGEWESKENEDRSGRRGLLVPFVVAFASVFLIAAAAVALKLSATSWRVDLAKHWPNTRAATEIESAESVVRFFFAETDPQKRLLWARSPDITQAHLARYPAEALSHLPAQIEPRGHYVENGLQRTSFGVHFDSGGYRLLEVVDTGAGLRVDWDSYARFCSASWEDLLSGKAESAEVRVFVSPGDYHNAPFENEQQWTCFRMMSPDLPDREDVFAYAAAGSPREVELKNLVMRATEFRQHLTLQIQGRETAGGKRLFEITRVMAVGWVLGEEDIEDAWSAR